MINQFYQLPLIPSESMLEQKFWQFHDTHPEVYWYLLDFANEWKRQSPDRQCGIKMLFERVRWELTINYHHNSEVKLNNNHAPFYARLLMRNNPNLDGLFKIRKQKIPSTLTPDQDGLEDNVQVI